MLTRELPFLRICLPLCLGIVTGYYLHPGPPVCLVILLTASASVLFSLFFNRQLTNPVFGGAFYLFLFSTGMTLFTIEINSLTRLKQKPGQFSGVISDFPEEKENSYMVIVRLTNDLTSGSVEKVTGSVILYSKKDSVIRSLIPGDIVRFRCTPFEISNRGNPCEFDYRFYMQSRGIKYYSFTSSESFLSIMQPEHRKLVHRALIIRNRIISMFSQRGIKGDRLALVSAITLGEKSQLDPEQKQYFIKAGVMHIMAVSGLHAVILSFFIFNLLFFLKGRLNIVRVIITLLILWAFAFITGLTASVLRATLMFSFLQTGKLLKRPVNPLNSVLASAVILILMRPAVIFDAGFLLSYAAVFYIILFYRDLYLVAEFKNRLMDLIWQSGAVTITAQAGTLPLTIMLFNRFPTWFIITNVIIVPVSSLLIIIGCLIPLTFPSVAISTLLARVLDLLTWLTEYLTEKAASLPLSTIENIGLTPAQCILLTLAITILLFFLLKKPSLPSFYPLSAFLLFSISVSVKYFFVSSSDELIVYNSQPYYAIGLRMGRELKLYTDNPEIPKEVIRHSSTMGLRVERNQLSPDPIFATINGYSIFISGKDSSDIVIPAGTAYAILTSDRAFAGRRYKFSLPEGTQLITLRDYPVSGLKKPGDSSGAPQIWSVRKSGAYRKRL